MTAMSDATRVGAVTKEAWQDAWLPGRDVANLTIVNFGAVRGPERHDRFNDCFFLGRRPGSAIARAGPREHRTPADRYGPVRAELAAGCGREARAGRR